MPNETQYDWEELQDYWRSHAEHGGRLDLEADPDALRNVCYPQAPQWLNEYIGETQVPCYESLLSEVPAASPGARALDLGCGSARWSRRLALRGYSVTGIDLQPRLIELNRERFPEIRFECCPIQEFEAAEPFDLISSVAVIQHNPPAEQERIVNHLRQLVRPGAYALVLESQRGQNLYVFSRSIEGWRELFARAGFELIAHRPYDFSPFIRATFALRNRVKRLVSRHSSGDAGNGAGDPSVPALSRTSLGGRLLRPLLRVSVLLDRPIEARLGERRSGFPATHCGFLFRAV